MEAKIQALVDRLLKIAAANDDEFNFRIDIEPQRRTPGPIYRFICEESAEGHGFVDGAGRTIEEAIGKATEAIPDALEHWSYEDAK